VKLSDLLFPRFCVICGKRIYDGSLCAQCAEKLNTLKKPDVRNIQNNECSAVGFYLFEYKSDEVKKVIFSLKQDNNSDLFIYVSKLLCELCDRIGFDGECVITNVPRKSVNVRKYGYDQSERLAKLIAKTSCKGIRYERLLKRRGFSDEQKNVGSAEKRRQNVHGKFKAAKKDIPGNVLLLDDVVTTGSSALECISALKAARSDVNIKCVFLASR